MSIINQILNKKRHKDSRGEESYIICPTCDKEIDYYWTQFAGVERAKCRTKGCYELMTLTPKKPKLILRKKPKLTPKKPKLILRKKKQLTLF